MHLRLYVVELAEELQRLFANLAAVVGPQLVELAPMFADAGVRVVTLRTGILLSREGGALKPMLLPFKLGLGGRIGDGRQYWSWIHIADFVSAVHYILGDVGGGASSPVRGPVNMVAPNPVTVRRRKSLLSMAYSFAG